MKTSGILATAFLCFGVACAKDEPPPEPPAMPEAPAPPPELVAPPEEDLPTAEALPVPDDFADEAATEITEASYRAQLDVLEKDVEADITADTRR
jgi:hypothetical protein